ncbi:MAG: heparinase II/III family protein [Acidobacteriota bacterium]
MSRRSLLLISVFLAVLLSAADAPGALEQAQTPASAVTPGHWMVIGPFPAEGNNALFKDYLTQAGGEADFSLVDSAGKRWQKAAADAEGRVFFHKLWPGAKRAVAYAFATLQCPEDRYAAVTLGSGNHVQIRLNGDIVYESRLSRKPESDKDTLLLPLRKGENRILAKVEGEGNSWALQWKTFFPSGAVFINEKEIVVPDVRVGHTLGAWGQVEVANASGKPLQDVTVEVLEDDEFKPSRSEPVEIRAGSVQRIPIWIAGKKRATEGSGSFRLRIAAGREDHVIAVKPQGCKPGAYFVTTYRSAVDGSVQPYSVLLPTSYDPSRRYPLILLLHGAHVTGWAQNIISYEPKEWVIQVAVHDRGNNRYRDIGEVDLYEVLAEINRLYLIDPDRIYLSGHSMGGYGTWFQATRYPDRWAAISPQAGYTNYSLYQKSLVSTANPAQEAFQKRLLEYWSPLSFAENLLHVPAYVVHGAKDDNIVVTHARQMVERLRELKYRVVYDENPEGGHWWGPRGQGYGVEVVDKPAISTFFQEHSRRATTPAHVIYKTDTLRYRKAYWVEIDELEEDNAPARIEAWAEADNTIKTVVSNIRQFTLRLDRAPVKADREVVILVNGKRAFRGRHRSFGPVTLRGQGGSYSRIPVQNPPEGRKRIRKTPDLYGPVCDAFTGPFVLVTGRRDISANQAAAKAAGFMIREWMTRANGIAQVKEDSEVTEQDIAARNLILFGNPATNTLIARLEGSLPIKFTESGFQVGGGKIEGEGVGAVFICPNPLNPDRYVVIVGVMTASSFATAARLRLTELPDYVIFDQDCLAGENVVFRDGGFFDGRWKVKQTAAGERRTKIEVPPGRQSPTEPQAQRFLRSAPGSNRLRNPMGDHVRTRRAPLESAPLAALSDRAAPLPDLRGSAVQPASVKDDFQGDGLSQWACYPPAQDVGYNPFLSPTPDFGAPGGRALMRVLKPNQDGRLHFGFIKRFRLLVSADARLALDCRIPLAAPGDEVEIGIAGGSGESYRTRLPVPGRDWFTPALALSELCSASGRPPAVGEEIQAVFVIARIQQASKDITYRFLVDNVTLAASAPVSFDVVVPRTVRHEPWAELVSARAYQAGETMEISAGSPVLLDGVECRLINPENRAVLKKQLDRSGPAGVWSGHALYRFSGRDTPGRWKFRLEGITRNREKVTTEVRFLLHPSHVAGAHPRLFFAREDRDRLVKRAADPRFAKWWEDFRKGAESWRGVSGLAKIGENLPLLDKQFLLPTLAAYFNAVGKARSVLSANAAEGYLLGNQPAVEAARSALLAVSRWPTWVPPWFNEHGQFTYYPVGQLAVDMALAYDLLYDSLTPAERASVRRALIDKAIVPAYREYVLDDRPPAQTSNWISHCVSGALVACAAIYADEEDGETREKLDIYINGLLQKLETFMAASFLPDGSYGEGISYQEFALETLSVAFPAIRRAFGIDYGDSTFVEKSLCFPLYALSIPPEESQDMGDTHPPAAHGIAPLVYASKDPVIRWYYGNFNRPSLTKFLFFDDLVAPVAPSLPPSRHFEVKGNAILRTGWGPDDAILVFRAGPNFNHNHCDQGSFLLRAFGENLITEAGWSDYYKDPYYEAYFTQAAGHNTVLVNGDPESQALPDTLQFPALNRYPKITGFLSGDSLDAVESRLEAVYKGRLKTFTRRLVFLKPNYLVVFDDLVTDGSPAWFSWRLHVADKDRIKLLPGAAVYEGKKAALAAKAFSPNPSEWQMGEGHIPYPVLSTQAPLPPPPVPGYLELRSGSVDKTQFLVVLIPSRTAEEGNVMAAGLSRVEGQGCLGLHAKRDGESDLVLFGENNQVSAFGDWRAQAGFWSVSNRGSKVSRFAVQNGTFLERAGTRLFESHFPLSLVVEYEPDRVLLTTVAAENTELELATDIPAARTVRLKVKKGQDRVVLTPGSGRLAQRLTHHD